MDEETRSALARLTAPLRGNEWPVRWVAPELWHLTVKFYGQREDGEVAGIEAGLAEAARGTPALDLHLASLGANAPERRARVLWVDVEAPPALELLHDRVERAGRAAGIEPEGRPFRPHLTLGRVRDGATLPAGAAEHLAEIEVGLPFLADRLVLFESVLGPGGPRYAARAAFPLASAA
jgi:2'-5' RNA ligase